MHSSTSKTKKKKTKALSPITYFDNKLKNHKYISSPFNRLFPLIEKKLPSESSTSDYGSYCSSESSFKGQNLSSDSIESDKNVEVEFDYSEEKYEIEDLREIRRDTRHTRTLRHKNVTVIIPKNNLSGYSTHEFYLEFINNFSFIPTLSNNTFHASEIVSVEPHGVRFCKQRPAFIFLPVNCDIQPQDKVICLCSNTPRSTSPCWEPIPPECVTFKNGTVIIKAFHFSLFTVIVQRPFIEKRQRITSNGGTVRLTEIPGVKVNFPQNALSSDVLSVVRVLYNTQQSMRSTEKALASPIVMVGPHGCSFNTRAEPVTVHLPIPHYKEICEKFKNNAKLSVWQSSTSEGEPFAWERLNITTSLDVNDSGLFILSFPVGHFSFFKVLWDVLSATLYEAKLGVAFFYPHVSFSMMCHAWMEENKDTQRFGLEVICYRSDKRIPSATNYKHRVGSCLKPKLIRPGCILVRLKSELFEADIEAGEDPLLQKWEIDFRGREFEKQFACRFRQGKPSVEKGTFGKVVVERKLSEGLNEPLFEFNLQKSGLEAESTLYETSDRWSVVAIKELAGTLRINQDDNWKKFANYIGFTKNEIESKFIYSDDPFMAMVNLYQTRGGTPEEFVQALYEVSRDLNVKDNQSGSSHGSPNSASGSGESSKRWRLWNVSPPKWREKDDGSDGTTSATETTKSSRKRSNPSKTGKTPANKRRRRFSDVSETISSSEESVGTEERQKDERKLQDTDIWQISSLMNTMTWRALGRTLGLDESVLLNIEQAYKATGFRECAYQMLLEWKGRKPKKCTFGTLYAALCKENMNSVAKQLSIIKLGEE